MRPPVCACRHCLLNRATTLSAAVRLRPGRQWGFLALLSAVCALGLGAAGMPASLLLGPMLAAIIFAVRGNSLSVPDVPFNAAQALLGCLIASKLTFSVTREILADWILFTMTAGATLLASAGLGWTLARFKVVPGTAAIWGSIPGAGAATVIMAEAFGADARLVATMVYFRAVCVALTASILASLLAPSVDVRHLTLPAHHLPLLLSFVETLTVAAVGGWAATRLRVPAGAFLGPMLLGAGLNIGGVLNCELPRWLLALAYACIGWRIGLGFKRDTLVAVRRAMPGVLVSVLGLIAFCAGLSSLLVVIAGMDPLTAFLATSPGGIDSVAIVATSTNVDVPFVMAFQTMRLVLALFAGPVLARFAAGRYRDVS